MKILNNRVTVNDQKTTAPQADNENEAQHVNALPSFSFALGQTHERVDAKPVSARVGMLRLLEDRDAHRVLGDRAPRPQQFAATPRREGKISAGEQAPLLWTIGVESPDELAVNVNASKAIVDGMSGQVHDSKMAEL